jgi:hypothetical protein
VLISGYIHIYVCLQLAIAEATLALVGILHRLELRPVPGLDEPAERIEFTVKPDQVKVIVRLRAHEG